MLTKEYSEAIVEVLDVLRNLDEETISRIPLSFIRSLNEKKSKTYKSNIDFSKDLKENVLKHQTKVILALIYRDYICETEEEREEFDSKLLKSYKNADEIFTNKQETINTQNKMILYEQENNFFKKIIKKIFNRK